MRLECSRSSCACDLARRNDPFWRPDRDHEDRQRLVNQELIHAVDYQTSHLIGIVNVEDCGQVHDCGILVATNDPKLRVIVAPAYHLLEHLDRRLHA